MSDRLLLCCLLKLLITFHSLAEEVNEDLAVKNTAADDEDLLPVGAPESTSQANSTTTKENTAGTDVTPKSVNDSESLVLDNSTKGKKREDNATELNSTSSDLPKWHCKRGNNTERNESLRGVLVVDAEKLLRWVNTSSTDNESDACAVVLFFTPYCPFCAKLAPLYNTLGRVFSSLPVLAIDAYKHHSLNTRFGVVAVPTILLFHSGKPVLKFNNSFSFDDLKDFVKNNTGIEGNYSIQVSQEDMEGPLPSVPIEERDSYLVFSVLFLVVFGFVMFAKSRYGQLVLDRVRGIPWERILQFVRREKQD